VSLLLANAGHVLMNSSAWGRCSNAFCFYKTCEEIIAPDGMRTTVINNAA